jgi:hypothetical protein
MKARRRFLTRLQSAPDEFRQKRLPLVAAMLRACRVCGCTDQDCRQCIARTGQPCRWVDTNLCSACEKSGEPLSPARGQHD